MKEKIEKKLGELKELKRQLIGQVNAVNGAIEVLEDLIKDDEIKEVGNG